MTGFDFFMACYRKGVDLPVRIFADSKAPMNFYRPNAVCFINLEADDESKPEHLALLNGMDVSIIANEAGERIRELAKTLIALMWLQKWRSGQWPLAWRATHARPPSA